MNYKILLALLIGLIWGCKNQNGGSSPSTISEEKSTPFLWENAHIYFLMTDRFYNGDTTNDLVFNRTKETGPLRNFMGGDIKGITQKIEEGYFDALGVTALWFTPVVEQVHDSVDEGTGNTYAYHGYWAKDWTALDPNFGTADDLKKLVETAHAHGIRVLLDVVINHTGPVTEQDPYWGEKWARQQPQCVYENYETTVPCALVANLPDIKTGSEVEVEIPAFLQEKWKKEGRLENELAELDAFFERTGYPRAPRYFIIKWLTDMIREYGVDGYRMDTMKHIEESVWADLIDEAKTAFEDWKNANPTAVLDDQDFFAVGEVYGYGASGGKLFNFGDRTVDYFAEGSNSLINFEFKGDANWDHEEIFTKYDELLHTQLKGYSTLNYVSSHDDGGPFDKLRERPFETATKLLLCPGQSQVYYGDETARLLEVPGAEGDANLRSFMNWEELENNTERNGYRIKEVLSHWQKLGQFRKAHPAIGAGRHKKITGEPYVFERVYERGDYEDQVVVGLGLPKGKKTIDVGNTFQKGMKVRDFYSGKTAEVKSGAVLIDSEFDIVLLEKL